MPCQTPYRGDTSQMLLFKIASCLAEGGSVAGVASFNGRTGVVTLTAADVVAALGCTPACEADTISQADGDARYVLKSGDSMTGALSIDNGSQVASDPYLSLSQTWNNGATTFTGLLSNVTNTASNTNSNLFNFQVDGVDRFNFTPGGSFRVVRQDATDSGMNLFLRKRGNAGSATGAVAADSTIGTVAYSGWDGTAFATGSRVSGLASEAWTNIAHGSRIDLYTTPVGSITEQITLRLSHTGQSQFLDGTAALPALSFQSDLNTGIYRVGADILGFSTAGVSRWQISASGNLLAATDNTYDIGAAAANRPQNIFAASNLFVESASGGVILGTAGARSSLVGVSSGTIRLSNNTSTDFNLLQFGGSTSSFPAIKRNGAGIDFRLADDSAFAGIATAGIVMSVGSPLSFTSGANTRAGNATLVGGTVTVANTSVTANTIVMLTRKTSGGTLGTAITYTVIAATSFTINSDSALDTSTFSYILIENP